MPEALKFHFDVDGEDFTSAGKACGSGQEEFKAIRAAARNNTQGLHCNVRGRNKYGNSRRRRRSRRYRE